MQTFIMKPVKVTVNPEIIENESKFNKAISSEKIEFKSESAQKAFDYLVKAFLLDFRQLRLPQERSGWRTLMAIANQGKISKYSVYG